MNRIARNVLIGAGAGLLATGAMSLAMAGFKTWGALGEPPPRKLTRKIFSRMGLPIRSRSALNLTALAGHFAYGACLGALFGLLPSKAHSAYGGAAYGMAIWSSNYAGWIPIAKLMRWPSDDRPGRATSMILSHLVFGSVLGAAVSKFSPERRESLRGKVVVVAGGSRGLGFAIANEAVKRGAKVALCARDEDEVKRAARALRKDEADVFAEVCDLRNEGETREFVARVENALGPIDVLVANAATIRVGPIESMTADDFHEAMASTFDTALHSSLSVLHGMIARKKGSLVFISSIGGKIGFPHLATYSAAKFAEVGYAESLSAETAKHGVHVLTVVPGLMRTGSQLHAEFSSEDEFAWFGLSATAPLISIDADRAARRILDAVEKKKTYLAFTPEARIAGRTNSLLREVWATAMTLTASMLPNAKDHAPHHKADEGEWIAGLSESSAVQLAERRGRSAAKRYGQIGTPQTGRS